MLTLAFDTATEVATSALVDDGEVLGERASRASTLLEDVDALLRQGGAHQHDLDALATGAPGALPVVDARRREIFTLVDGSPVVLAPADLELAAGTVCVGDGARRYRELLEGMGAVIPPDGDERHLPRARFHALLAHDFGSVEEIEPLYLRVPDADRSVAG